MSNDAFVHGSDLIQFWLKRLLHHQTNNQMKWCFWLANSWNLGLKYILASRWQRFLPNIKRMVTLDVLKNPRYPSDCLLFICSSIVANVFRFICSARFCCRIACKCTKHRRIVWINYIRLEVNERYFNWIGCTAYVVCIACTKSLSQCTITSSISIGKSKCGHLWFSPTTRRNYRFNIQFDNLKYGYWLSNQKVQSFVALYMLWIRWNFATSIHIYAMIHRAFCVCYSFFFWYDFWFVVCRWALASLRFKHMAHRIQSAS